MHDFKGVIAHSANYPKDLSLAGKKVAVVGTGSSGIQLVANAQPLVQHLYTWIRSPTFMTAGFAQRYSGPDGANFICEPKAYCYERTSTNRRFHLDTEAQKEKLRNDPDFYLKYRKSIETEMVSGFTIFHRNTPESKTAFEYASNEMMTKLKGREDLADTLIPTTFPVGCKRPTYVLARLVRMQMC